MATERIYLFRSGEYKDRSFLRDADGRLHEITGNVGKIGGGTAPRWMLPVIEIHQNASRFAATLFSDSADARVLVTAKTAAYQAIAEAV